MSSHLLTFPAMHPGESLYSIVSRYHVLIGHRIHITTIRELYERPFDLRLLFALPCKVNCFRSWLPGRLGITPEMITTRHTAWNYASLAPQFDSAVLERLASVKSSRGPGKRKALMKCLLDATITIRFCPQCANEEKQKYRESYWHTLHTLKGIRYCPVYRKPLQEIMTSDTSSLNRFITAEELMQGQCDNYREIASDNTSSEKEHLRLAELVNQILTADDAKIAELRKWLKKAENQKTGSILETIRNFGGDDFFRSIWTSDELMVRSELIEQNGIRALEPLEAAMFLYQNRCL